MSDPQAPVPVESWWPPPYPPPPQRKGPSAGVIVAVVLACLVVVVPLGVAAVLTASRLDLDGPAGVSAADAGCGPDSRVAAADRDAWHVPVGQKVEYAVTPPAFGRHWPNYLQGIELRRLYTPADRPPVERLVHSLEHGYTILWYDATVDPAELAELAEEAGPKFIAAPWLPADGPAFQDGVHVVLTHWVVRGRGSGDAQPAAVAAEVRQAGVWRRCEQLSGEVVDDYMTAYPYTNSREPNAP
ncbi:MAG TPA: DUF3105 domain-containing protein [Nocardioidaceae bacterium]|nr:DUF3105 domain-containing protein [Nocardioidaceae bacterium]